MQALLINSKDRTVELVEIEPGSMANLLGTVRIDTVDLDEYHTVLIGDDLRYADHPFRFRFARGSQLRPFFGPALIVGLTNGNWTHVTLDAMELQPHIIWERWEETSKCFVPVIPG